MTSGLVRTVTCCFPSLHLLVHTYPTPCTSRVFRSVGVRFPSTVCLLIAIGAPRHRRQKPGNRSDYKSQCPEPQPPRPTTRSPTRCPGSQHKKNSSRPKSAAGKAGNTAVTPWPISTPMEVTTFLHSAVLTSPVCTSLRRSSSLTRHPSDWPASR